MDESKLLLEHQKLIYSVVRRTVKYCRQGNEIEDYMSEANIAALKAIRTYQGDKNAKLSTYISTCVKNRLADIFKHYGRAKIMQEDLYDVENFPQTYYEPSNVVFSDDEEDLMREILKAGERRHALAKITKKWRIEKNLTKDQTRRALNLCFSRIHQKLK
jgi:RNA polymerase sigma factor (sigma-70 family)